METINGVTILGSGTKQFLTTMDRSQILMVTESLLTTEIQNFLEKTNHDTSEAFSVLDVLGPDWLGTPSYAAQASFFYKHVFYCLYNNNKPASQQIGKLFRNSAKRLGFKQVEIDDSRGRKKAGYVLEQ